MRIFVNCVPNQIMQGLIIEGPVLMIVMTHLMKCVSVSFQVDAVVIIQVTVLVLSVLQLDAVLCVVRD